MTDQLGALTTIFTEFYYWVTVVLTVFNSTSVSVCMKSELLDTNIPNNSSEKYNVNSVSNGYWFFFWLVDLLGIPTGPGIAPSIMTESTALITDDSTFSAKWYLANSEFMAINLGDHISGVFWAAFYYFHGQRLLSSLEQSLKELQLLHLEF
jgi:Amt family ammonium transporter